MEYTKPGKGMTVSTAFVQNVTKDIGIAHVAAQGLKNLGYTVERFNLEDIDKLPITPATMVVTFIEPFRAVIEKLTGKRPDIYNYPEQLIAFRDRKIWEDTLGNIRNNPDKWPVFIKPANDIKTFPGVVIRSATQLLGQAGLPNETPVHCSELVNFRSEYRCFVKDKVVIGCRHYKGDPLSFPDPETICQMVAEWKDSPTAYCLDVGVANKDGKNKTLLVEINAANSAGDYGLDCILYAQFLLAYWCELTGAAPLP